MKKSKKTLKGMTLVEMIISIAIFAVMGGLLVLVGTHIDATNRATNILKTKISKESPYAANGKYDYTKKDSESDESARLSCDDDFTVDIDIAVFDDAGNQIGNEASATLNAWKYNTKDIIEDGLSEADKAALQKKPNGGLNLQFISYDPPAGESESEETPEETPEETAEETPAEGTPDEGTSDEGTSDESDS